MFCWGRRGGVKRGLKKSRGGLKSKVVKLVKVVETSGVIFWEKPKMRFLRSFFVFTNQSLVRGVGEGVKRLFVLSKIKGRASKVFCQGNQAIVCSVEKTLFTLKLRRNMGAPWRGSSVAQKIQRGAENESCKSRKSSGNIWCYLLGKTKNVIFTVFFVFTNQSLVSG